MDNKLYKLMDWPAIEEIVYSESSHALQYIRRPPCKRGVSYTGVQTDAVSVSVSVSERKRAIQLEKVDMLDFLRH